MKCDMTLGCKPDRPARRVASRLYLGARLWPVLATLACLTAAPLPTSAADAEAHARTLHEHALAEYEAGHYAQAIRYFRSAAELGDARAPEVLAMMYRHGERLYGHQVRADRQEAARWVELAVARQRTAAEATVATLRR